LLTYSRKLFIPLTRLCRDVCAYCTFATAPRDLPAPYMTPDEVMTLVAQGRAAGCAEALITLGDKPEDRYAVARAALESMGHASTIDYVEAMAGRILHETGMLPHINAGVLDYDDYVRLRRVSASMGLMLESTSRRLLEKGMPHHGSPDKDPDVRIASIAAAGRAGCPSPPGCSSALARRAQSGWMRC
jgi:FO synthase